MKQNESFRLTDFSKAPPELVCGYKQLKNFQGNRFSVANVVCWMPTARQLQVPRYFKNPCQPEAVPVRTDDKSIIYSWQTFEFKYQFRIKLDEPLHEPIIVKGFVSGFRRYITILN